MKRAWKAKVKSATLYTLIIDAKLKLCYKIAPCKRFHYNYTLRAKANLFQITEKKTKKKKLPTHLKVVA